MSKRYGRLLFALAAALSLAAWLPRALAQESFYKGKTIRIIVGFSAGGGYDTYSRLIARHMTNHIPGNPTIVVENMAGAGSLIAANHVFKVAKPDGLTIGHFIGGLFMLQLLGKPGVEFDARSFEYLGVPAQDNYVVGLSRASGIAGMGKWMAASKTPLKLGGLAPGVATDDITNVLKTALGLPIQLVSGYKGMADIRLAFNSGEVLGVVNAWESFKSTWSKELESGDLNVVLQVLPKPHPDLPKVPLAVDFAKTEEMKKLIDVAGHGIGRTARPYVLPPGTPKDRVQIMRKAFMDTMTDPEFLAEAKKARLDIFPADGSELERNVKKIFELEPALIVKLKDVLK